MLTGTRSVDEIESILVKLITELNEMANSEAMLNGVCSELDTLRLLPSVSIILVRPEICGELSEITGRDY